MNAQDQIKALAELDGPPLFVIRKPIHDPFGYYRKDACGYCGLNEAWRVTEEVGRLHIGGRPTDHDRVILEPAPTKPYLTSYDAILPLVQKQPVAIKIEIMSRCCLLDAPTQLCEALLRATGKWRE